MKQDWTISPILLLTGDPIKVGSSKVRIYQPVVKDIAVLGEERFGSMIYIWNLKRDDLIKGETDDTWDKEDIEIFRQAVIYNPQLRKIFEDSVMFFLHDKVEFLKMEGTIFIGELQTGVELSEELFEGIRSIINQVTQHKEEKKKLPGSKKAQEIEARIRAGEERVRQLKRSNGIDPLTVQVSGFVAHSHKTYEEVFAMTLVQFNNALNKTVQIENYNISSMLSPYMDKKDKGKNKHWLND